MTAATQEFTGAGIVSTADVEKGTINVVADIAAKPEAVFRALTDPKQLEQWWGKPGMYQTERWEIDLRPGGKWVSHVKTKEGDAMTAPDASPQLVRGEYITVDPPRVLEYTWSPSWDGFAVTTVRCEIEPTPTGSRLTLTHSGFRDRKEMITSHGEGWVRVLGWMSEWIATQ
jgi:uncharacterized protein YndB with AHSA1/START domain